MYGLMYKDIRIKDQQLNLKMDKIFLLFIKCKLDKYLIPKSYIPDKYYISAKFLKIYKIIYYEIIFLIRALIIFAR